MELTENDLGKGPQQLWPLVENTAKWSQPIREGPEGGISRTSSSQYIFLSCPCSTLAECKPLPDSKAVS